MGRTSPREIARRRAAEVAESRTDAMAQMNSKLSRKFTLIDKQLNDLRAENLRYYYQIGQLCEEIRTNPNDFVGKDGTPGLKLVEQGLSTQARTLRKAAMFARTCDEKEMEDLISWYNTETGFTLHWGHVAFLLTLDDKKKRSEFAEMAVEETLDPPALHERIKKKTGRKGGHGRKHEMPKTIGAQVRQLLTISKQFMGKHEGVWAGDEESVFSNLMELEADDVSEDMVDQLHEIEELMQQISEAAEANVASTERAREHIEAVLEAAAEEAAAEEAAATQVTKKERRSIDLDSPRSIKKNKTA